MIPCASQNRRPPLIAPVLIAYDDHLTLGKALKHHETRRRGTQAARAGARANNRCHMNPLLSRLQPYPFERLRQLFATVTPSPDYPAISLGIGEPRHATPEFIKSALTAALGTGLASYPATAGEPTLREACAAWMQRRYGLELNPATQVLPVNGSREALFAPSDPSRNFAVDWDSVPDDVWARTQLLYVCSPGNPTGAVMPLAEWQKLFELSDRHGFVIASDECYSEIYFRDEPPLGGLEAAMKLGRTEFRNLIALTSLSKRSNVPGLRSGFVAGDAALIKPFLLYRTYHGSAMSPVVQAASIAAWNDEAHVVENRRMYREKFAAVTPLLSAVMDVALPDASFYLWAGVPAFWQGNDTAFARELLAQYNVTVLPGSYLAREAAGHNPGQGRIRMALVAETAECLEAARRIVQFILSRG